MLPQLDTAKVVEVFKGAVADTAERLDQVYDALWKARVEAVRGIVTVATATSPLF
jgi:hypothetical protein